MSFLVPQHRGWIFVFHPNDKGEPGNVEELFLDVYKVIKLLLILKVDRTGQNVDC